jgi:hypothetical protein
MRGSSVEEVLVRMESMYADQRIFKSENRQSSSLQGIMFHRN